MVKRVFILDTGIIGTRIVRTALELGYQTVVLKAAASENTLSHQLADQTVQLDLEMMAEDAARVIVDAADALEIDLVHPGRTIYNHDRSLTARCSEEGITYLGPSAATLDALEREEALHHAVDAADGDIGVLRSGLTPQSACIVEVVLIARKHDTTIVGAHEILQSYNNVPLVSLKPPPSVDEGLYAALCTVATALVDEVAFSGIGTVRFAVDRHHGPVLVGFIPHLTLGHTLYEVGTVYDLCYDQFKLAGAIAPSRGPPSRIHSDDRSTTPLALQSIVLPSLEGEATKGGRVRNFALPGGPFLRIDENITTGTTIAPESDAALCSVTVWGHAFSTIRHRMSRALEEMQIKGLWTNREYLRRFLLQDLLDDLMSGSSEAPRS